jgi:hypothetical protein
LQLGLRLLSCFTHVLFNHWVVLGLVFPLQHGASWHSDIIGALAWNGPHLRLGGSSTLCPWCGRTRKNSSWWLFAALPGTRTPPTASCFVLDFLLFCHKTKCLTPLASDFFCHLCLPCGSSPALCVLSGPFLLGYRFFGRRVSLWADDELAPFSGQGSLPSIAST